MCILIYLYRYLCDFTRGNTNLAALRNVPVTNLLLRFFRNYSSRIFIAGQIFKTSTYVCLLTINWSFLKCSPHCYFIPYFVKMIFDNMISKNKYKLCCHSCSRWWIPSLRGWRRPLVIAPFDLQSGR